jgi:hypothetical protein
MPDTPNELKVYKHVDSTIFSRGHYKIMPTENHGYQLTNEKGDKLVDGITYFNVEHTLGQLPQVTLTLNAVVDVELPDMSVDPIRIS